MNYYTDELNVQILLSLLKAHNIKYVVSSPGSANSPMNASMQYDKHFKVFSCVDERSAAYMACGLADETGCPVVLSCTGATASRNYFPGITEAYYRKLPILAVTSTQPINRVGHLTAQVIDRSTAPNDSYTFSVGLPVVLDLKNKWECEIAANKAVLELYRRGGGPVHINLETNSLRTYATKELPHVRKIDRFYEISELPKLIEGKVAIFIGSHKNFSLPETDAIEKFCESHNAVVIHDHTSGYYGKYRVNMSLVASQKYQSSDAYRPNILIHIGEVSGDYPSMRISGRQVWRVSPDGEIRDTFKKLRYVFEMREIDFFRHYTKNEITEMTYYRQCVAMDTEVRSKLPDLPLSNIWLASQLAHRLPPNSVIHFGILNSLRSWNLFPLPDTVRSSSNVGGFGIDGGMSTLVGASLANPDKLYYLVIGDLAFFYDMNCLGNRHVGKNLRILLVNNGRGTEFRQYDHHTSHFGDYADDYIAAAGHFGNKSLTLVKNYAENLGFEYISASSKVESEERHSRFMHPKITEKSMIFEVFTNSDLESMALELMMNIATDPNTKLKNNAKIAAKSILGDKGIQTLRKIRGR